jgi:hypothetical protein
MSLAKTIQKQNHFLEYYFFIPLFVFYAPEFKCQAKLLKLHTKKKKKLQNKTKQNQTKKIKT